MGARHPQCPELAQALHEENQMTATSSTNLTATRRALHGVAELVLAGPHYRAGGSIRLRLTPGGFGTMIGPLSHAGHEKRP
jgi:hypothetical protein